jgi:hypothetical protein
MVEMQIIVDCKPPPPRHYIFYNYVFFHFSELDWKMPPKKKHKAGSANPGVGRRYLNEKFSVLPSASDIAELKKGHILRLCIVEAGSSRTETERRLKVHFSLEDYSFRSSVNSNIKMLITHTSNKLKRLTDPKEFEKFSAICDERFDLTVDPQFAVPVSKAPDIPDAVPSTSTSTSDGDDVIVPISPEPDEQSTVGRNVSDTMTKESPDDRLPVHSEPWSCRTRSSSSRRGIPLTPQKAKMKKRLEFMTQTCSAMKEEYQTKMGDLKGKLKSPKRCINQAVQRQKDKVEKKNKEIRKLKSLLYGNALYCELEKERRLNHKLKDKHRKILKKKSKLGHETVSMAKYDEVIRKMKEKDAVIEEVRHDNLLLQEKVDDLKGRVPP